VSWSIFGPTHSSFHSTFSTDFLTVAGRVGHAAAASRSSSNQKPATTRPATAPALSVSSPAIDAHQKQRGSLHFVPRESGEQKAHQGDTSGLVRGDREAAATLPQIWVRVRSQSHLAVPLQRWFTVVARHIYWLAYVKSFSNVLRLFFLHVRSQIRSGSRACRRICECTYRRSSICYEKQKDD